jgi:carboxylesterase type B
MIPRRSIDSWGNPKCGLRNWRSPRPAAGTFELAYLFGYYDDPGARLISRENPERHPLATRMQNAFVGQSGPGRTDLAWPRYGSDRRATMTFDTPLCQWKRALMEDERRVWEELLR